MNSNRRTGFLVAGIVVLIVGLIAAVGLWYSAGQRQSDAVRDLARAPVGCDTTLNFEVAGEFLVFLETEGEISAVTGSCVAPGSFGQLGSPRNLPPVRLALTGPDGSDVALDTRTGVDYDSDGSAGQVIRTFVVGTPGDYVLRVEPTNGSEPAGYAIAIGRDPSNGVQPLQLGAFAAGITGLIVGLSLIAVSRRRGTPEALVPVDPWSSAPEWPTSPPGAQQPPQSAGWEQQPGPPMQPPGSPVPTAPTTSPSTSTPSPWSPPKMPSQ
jgi:hypothetical protein